MRNRTQGFTLIEILVVITIIASLAGAVLVLVPRIQKKQQQQACAGNLKQLGTLWSTWQMEHPGRPKHNGVSLFLYFRQKHLIQKGQEEVLVCPGDNSVTHPSTPDDEARYDEIDLTDPPPEVCSYMVRDFWTYPLRNDSPDVQIIACDKQGADNQTAHHPGGINVLFEDTSAKLMEHEALGLTTKDTIVVGPDSDVEMLSQVIYAPAQED